MKSCANPMCTMMIAGHCQYCVQDFCAKHRVPEDHVCENYQKCIDTVHQRIATKLTQEAIHTPKIIFF
jgi:predicted nucleic acid binding AN1-type Zn finger protein